MFENNIRRNTFRNIIIDGIIVILERAESGKSEPLTFDRNLLGLSCDIYGMKR